jgi:glutathione S-transferase
MGATFADERVPFTDGWHTWTRLKSDPALSGPFGKLPVLVWDGRLHAETLVISSFLQRALDPSDRSMPIAQAQSALSDDLRGLYELLNLDQVAPGADTRSFAVRAESRLADSFRRYDAVSVGPDSPFLSPTGHSIASFWLHEVWQLAQLLLGRRADVLVNGLSDLSALLEAVNSLPAVKHPQEAVPAFWSARPDEPKRLASLQSELE